MSQLVIVQNDQPVTTSLQVAEAFEVDHKNVLRDIRDLMMDINKSLESSNLSAVDTPTFMEDSYQSDSNRRKYPMFLMDKNGWTLLVMGYKGKRATQFKLQYIAQFEQMKRQIENKQQLSLPQNYASALRQLAEQVEENEKLKIQLKQQDFEQGVIEQVEIKRNVLYTTEEIAEQFGYKGMSGVHSFNKLLQEHRVIYPRRKGRNINWQLYSPLKNKGLKDLTSIQSSQRWTEKGKYFIEELLNTKEV